MPVSQWGGFGLSSHLTHLHTTLSFGESYRIRMMLTYLAKITRKDVKIGYEKDKFGLGRG